MDCVATPGPPPVRANGMSKSLIASARRSSSTMTIVGVSIGNMILANKPHLDLLSIFAASINSLGIPCSAAKNTRKQKGVHCQISTRITENKAQLGLERKGTPRKPSGPPSS